MGTAINLTETLLGRIETLQMELKLAQERISQFDEIFEILPCPDHGKCVPYIIEEIKRCITTEPEGA